MTSPVQHLLQDLIRAPSVNPAFSNGQEDIAGEHRVTSFLEQWCGDRGLGSVRQPVEAHRENFIAILPGSDRLLLWEVHQDTVGIDGMTIDPFAGTLDGDRIWGRGACDVKGSMAAMLVAIERLATLPINERATIVLDCTVNEECGNTGAHRLARLWQPERRTAETLVGNSIVSNDLFSRAPYAAIVAELTMFDTVVAHKGIVRWRARIHGRAAHTSDPAQGVNAVYGAARVALAVQRYAVEVLSQKAAHELCGAPQVCVSTLHGGSGVNTVADLATLEIDRRITPAEEPTAARAELTQYIEQHAELGECRVTHEPPFGQMEALADRANGNWADDVIDAARRAGRRSRPVGANYGTDAPAIAATGVPTVVIGPGSIAQAHTADEWISVEQLEQAVQVYFEIGKV